MFFQALSAAGSIMAGIGAQQEARLNAFNMETEKVLNKARAEEMAQARREEYDLATASNIANFSKGTELASRSVEAFLMRQKETMAKDQTAIANNTFRQNLKIEQQKLAERRRGRNALMSSLFQAAGTIGEGLQQSQQTKVP